MPEQTKKNNLLQWLACPKCQGQGKVKEKNCPQCKGKGFYGYFNNHLLDWDEKISLTTIFLDQLKIVLNFLINFLLVIFAFVGLILLVLSALNYFLNYETVSLLKISQDKISLIFWFSILTDLYLFYRFSLQADVEKKKKIKFIAEETSMPIEWEQIETIAKNKKINLNSNFSLENEKLIHKAWSLARKLKHQESDCLHLFAALIQTLDIRLLFNRLGLPWEKLKTELSSALSKLPVAKKDPYISSNLKKIFFRSYLEATGKKSAQIRPFDLLLALVKEEGTAREILYDLEIDEQKIANVILWIQVQKELQKRWINFKSAARAKPKGIMDRAFTAVATPFLDQFSHDLTALARTGLLPVCVGRDEEIKQIFALIESGKNSFILVGYPEVGKMSVIEGITQMMVTEDVPKPLKDKRLVNLSISALVSGASQTGEIEERLNHIMFEVARAGNIVLFIEDIHNIIGISTTKGELDLSEVLAEGLNKGVFYFFSTSDPVNYHKYLETKGLGNVLQKINLDEPGANQTIQILETKTGTIEYKQQVYFSYEALDKAVTLSTRYLKEHYLPQKAINLLEEAAVYVRRKKGKKSIITGEDIAEVVAQKTGIQVTKVTEKEAEKLINLEEKIHSRIIGQDEAVSAVATALRRARTELREAKKPIVNLLFLGPTGVGKTELAKTVTEIYFGAENKMIRLDMSEYQEKASIDRMIGAPGKTSGGILTEAVRKTPFSLLLLDELEKAHPDLLNLFLQVMDDGRLTDNEGRTIDFTNIILIATSNAGTSFIQEQILKNTPLENIKQTLIKDKLSAYFRPEFLNRFNDIIVFKPLSIEEIQKITRLNLNKLVKQMLEKGITLKYTDEAVNELAQAGFDPIFGARPLQRVIEERVNNALANYLLKGKLDRRDVAILEAKGIIRVEKAAQL